MPRGTRNGIALAAVLDRNHPKRREWTQGLENGSTRPFKSDLRPLRKHCRACSKISKNTSLMADLFADQIINGESTGASDLAGRTRSPSFVELVLILCLVAKEQLSA